MNYLTNQIKSIIGRLDLLENINPQNNDNQSNLSIDENVIENYIQPPPPPEPDRCPICLDEMKVDGLVILDCGHKMDLSCFMIFIKTSTGKKCPMCRNPIIHPPHRLNPPRRRLNPRSSAIRRFNPQPLQFRNFEDLFGDDSDDDSSDDEIILNPILINPPRPNPRPFRLNQTMRRILDIMGTHHLPTSVIKERIRRRYNHQYSSGCLTSNFRKLVRNGYLNRRGNRWIKINRNN